MSPTYPTSCRNFPRRKLNSTSGQKLQNCKMPDVPMMWKTPDMLRLEARSKKCNRCGDTPHAKGFQCQARRFQCKICHKFGHFTSVCSKKAKANTLLIPFMQGNQKHNNYIWGALYTLQDAGSSEYDSDPEENFCLQMKVHRTRISHPEVPKLVYLMANLAYRLKEHHARTNIYGQDFTPAPMST